MTISVEFYGIPRARADVGRAMAAGTRLGEVLRDLARQFPDFAETCVDDNRLRPGYVANLDGRQFISDPETPLADCKSLLILSADAGG